MRQHALRKCLSNSLLHLPSLPLPALPAAARRAERDPRAEVHDAKLEVARALGKMSAAQPGRVPQLEVPGEGDTLGNLLQSTAMDELVGEGKPMSFVGYFCPHPLEKRVVFRIASPDPMAAFQAMKDAALARVKELAHLVSEAAARKG